MPQREILWNVPPAVMAVVYLLSGVALVWGLLWFARRGRRWARGGPAPDQMSWRVGLARLTGYLLTHRKIAADPYAGWMHRLIFWGFVTLLIATTLVGVQHHLGWTFLTGTTYLIFSLGADLGGVALSVGLGMALWRRRSRPAHGRLLPAATTTLLLWLLLAVTLTGFLVEGARIAVDFPAFERYSPVGYLTALALDAVGLGGAAAPKVHLGLWVGHAALAIVFFAVIPITLMKHILVAAYSVARPAGRPGLLHEPAEPITAGVRLEQFRRIDLVQADACLTCGLCTQACPAHAAGKPLSPRSIVLGLREHLNDPRGPLALQVADDALWSCTACAACDLACPVNIHVLEKIVTLRRGRVAVGALPDSAGAALESSAQKFNPFGGCNSARMEWAAGLNVPVAQDGERVELLYWVGCAGAFDPAGREVTRAMVKILTHLKVPYRVLGCKERCTGDPARRLGEEGLWRELAEDNQRTFAAHGVRTILTQCPHCFHAFANEYPSVGPTPRVIHHSQWLRERIADGSLAVHPNTAETITFHDPCYLGRINSQTEAPRAVLDALATGRRTEMPLSGRDSFCCGGGGGQMWLDVRGETRVETIRAGHVERTGAGAVATGCPFCRVMLEAGRAGLPAGQGNWRVRDLAELVVERLAEGRP